MADIRIKDLTTTASSTASDDFIAVDGTTNGTRKLNAFSPTFGGNATVTGTLTVNGSTLTSAGSLLVNGATSAALFSGQAAVAIKGGSGGAAIYLSDATGSTPGATSPTLHFASSTDGISLRAASGVFQVIDETQPGAGDGALRLSVNNAGVVSIPATTASTSTSSGALVVGNGTSGGLGVGGAIVAGGAITTGNDVLDVAIYVPGNTAIRTKDGSSTKLYIDTKTVDGGDIVLRPRAATALTLAAGTGNVSIAATTASTTTSSGALVVSGGVGVAKSLNVGEAVTVAGGSFAAASFYKSASLGMVLSGATGSSYDLYLTNPAGNYVMQVPTGTRNAEFAATLTTVGAITSGASISTSAPVGGAGAWELGTYSSTAPSATGYVTIEIGGTVYKLLASNV